MTKQISVTTNETITTLIAKLGDVDEVEEYMNDGKRNFALHGAYGIRYIRESIADRAILSLLTALLRERGGAGGASPCSLLRARRRGCNRGRADGMAGRCAEVVH